MNMDCGSHEPSVLGITDLRGALCLKGIPCGPTRVHPGDLEPRVTDARRLPQFFYPDAQWPQQRPDVLAFCEAQAAKGRE